MGAHMIDSEGAGAVLVGGVESISLVQPLAAPFARGVDRGAQARALHDDDRDGGHRRRALRHQPRGAGRAGLPEPAAHGRGAGGGPLRRRDRADGGHQGGEGQGDAARSPRSTSTVAMDECNRPSTTLEALRKLEPVRGEGKLHHRGQRLAALGRRGGAGAGARGRRGARGADAARAVPGLCGRGLRARRDGHRARSLPFRACSSARG